MSVSVRALVATARLVEAANTFPRVVFNFTVGCGRQLQTLTSKNKGSRRILLLQMLQDQHLVVVLLIQIVPLHHPSLVCTDENTINAQHSIAQHSTAQHSTHSTAQHVFTAKPSHAGSNCAHHTHTRAHTYTHTRARGQCTAYTSPFANFDPTLCPKCPTARHAIVPPPPQLVAVESWWSSTM